MFKRTITVLVYFNENRIKEVDQENEDEDGITDVENKDGVYSDYLKRD